MPISKSYRSLLPALQQHVAEKPNAVALRYLETGSVDGPIHEWSYSDLYRRAGAIAEKLAQQNLNGQRVLLQYEHGLEFIAAFIGCLYAKTIPVPVYPPTPADVLQSLPRIKSIYADARAGAVLCSQAQYDLVLHADAQETSSWASEITDTWLVTQDIVLSDAHHPQDLSSAPVCQPDDLAFLQYTSGSTGHPKGVMVSHGNLAANLSVITQCFGFPDHHNMVCWLPHYHDMGLIGNLLYPLYHGFPVTFMAPSRFILSPLKWLKAISHYKATLVTAPDFAYRLVINVASKRRLPDTLDLSSLEIAINAAEPIHPDTFHLFQQALAPYGLREDVFYPTFGLAESTLLVATKARGTLPKTAVFDRDKLTEGHAEQVSQDDSDPNAKKLSSCGAAVPGHQMRIIDPETQAIQPEGHIGELCIHGPSVTEGYWRKDEINANLFVTLGADSLSFLRTGDLGFMLDGELFFTGRLKDLIIVRGKNYAPQDLENTVSEINGIRPGCVIAFSVDASHFGVAGGGEKVVLVAERAKQGEADDALMAQACQKISVAHGLEVSSMVLIERRTLPKTTSGKLGRAACRTQFLNNSLKHTATFDKHSNHANLRHCAPSINHNQDSTPLITVADIRKLIATHVNIPLQDIAEDQSFNALGLDSFQLIQLTHHLERTLSREMDAQALYSYPTPLALVDYLNACKTTDSPASHAGVKENAVGLTSDVLYRDLPEVLKKSEKISTNYQFDLDNDVAWGRIDEPGDFYPAVLLEAAGLDAQALASEPQAWELFQWATALTVCITFEILETGLVEFGDLEQDRLGNTRSMRNFCDEEIKHVKLFRRLGHYLRARCPSHHADAVQQLEVHCRDTYQFLTGLFTQERPDASDHVALSAEHFTLWLDCQFFESFSIYLYHELAKAQDIQPTWLSAHLCHAREEVHHVMTGANYIGALNIPEKMRLQLSEEFMEKYNKGFLEIFCLSAPIKLIQTIWPELHFFPDNTTLVKAPVFESLSTLKVFKDLRKQVNFRKFGEQQRSMLAYLEDIKLADEITLQPINHKKSATEQILLTGVTGFLGAFLLKDLLAQTNAQVVCLVRAKDVTQGEQRLKDNLTRYKLWDDAMAARVRVMVGDLALPQLGLDNAAFDALSCTIDSIYHNGAVLDFNKDYAALKAINVMGTLGILKLATHSKNIPVHYVSTVSAFDSSSHYDTVVNETDIPDYQDIFLGYSQSKWVAEQLVLAAGKKGLLTTVMRVGTVTGDSRNGTWNTDDIICRLLKGSALVGSFPALDIHIDMTPVDYVSRALVKLALGVEEKRQGDSAAQVYHLNTPTPISWHKMMSWMNFYGYHMKQVDYHDWLDDIKQQSIEALNPLLPLVPFLSAIRTQGRTALELLEMKPKFDNAETLRVLMDTKEPIEGCPQVDAGLLEKYFAYFHEVTFLLSPKEHYEAQTHTHRRHSRHSAHRHHVRTNHHLGDKQTQTGRLD